jgi:hypothetical protein
MPLQLLNLGVIFPRMIYRMFITRTPRGKRTCTLFSPFNSCSWLDFAELNAPPMINYGVVYPQAILIFVITLLYSVIQPLILIFGAVYFGSAYVVYKYKLLFGEFASSPEHLALYLSIGQFSINLTNLKVRHGRSRSPDLSGVLLSTLSLCPASLSYASHISSRHFFSPCWEAYCYGPGTRTRNSSRSASMSL